MGLVCINEASRVNKTRYLLRVFCNLHMIHISCAHNRWLYAVAIILHSLYITHLISANYYHDVDRTRCLSQNVNFPDKRNITYIIALHLPSSSVLLAQYASQWRYNQRASVSNHRRLDCLLNRLFKRRSKKTSKLCVTGLCEGNWRVTGEFTAQRTSNAEKVSIWIYMEYSTGITVKHLIPAAPNLNDSRPVMQ